MAEALGIASAIIGISCAGVKLSKTLYHVGNRAVSANHDIYRIATAIALFSSTLKHVGAVFGDSQSLHSPEAAETADSIIRECERLYEQIGQMVFKLGGNSNSERSRRSSLAQKVKWHFEAPKVEYLLAQLEYLKTTLAMMLQTLSLAALTAKVRQEGNEEQADEQIDQERSHVEALFLAQQVSLTVVNNVAYFTNPNDRAATSSPESDSNVEALEGSSPKLLTEQPHRTDSMISLRFGNGHLSFLDRQMARDDEPFSPVLEQQHVVEQLLDRWTVLSEPLPATTTQNSEREVYVEPGAIPPPSESAKDNVEPESRGLDVPPPPPRKSSPLPELRVNTADQTPQNNELALSSPLTSPVPPSPPQNSYLEIRAPLGNVPGNPRMQPQYPVSGAPNDKLPLVRTFSAPVTDFPPPPSIMGALQPYQAPAQLPQPRGMTPTPMSQAGQGSIYAPPSVTRAPLSPQVAQVGAQPGYYQYPSFTPGITRQPVETQQHVEEEARVGLNIPWRIRIGTKYWDFLDDKLIGPRAPYLPTEPMSWIYSHDSAQTEISSLWVCPDAISERKYPYYEIYRDDHDERRNSRNYTWHAEQQNDRHYAILQPLKFVEIEALVERTIHIGEQSKAQKNSRTEAGRPQPRGLQGRQRTVSFSDAAPRNLRPDNSFDRSPRTSGEYLDRGDRGVHYAPPHLHSYGSRDGGRHHDSYGYDEWSSDERSPGRTKMKKKPKKRPVEVEKTKHKSYAGTIAKIGGLVAMLDGLDGLIL